MLGAIFLGVGLPLCGALGMGMKKCRDFEEGLKKPRKGYGTELNTK